MIAVKSEDGLGIESEEEMNNINKMNLNESISDAQGDEVDNKILEFFILVWDHNLVMFVYSLDICPPLYSLWRIEGLDLVIWKM